MRASRSRGWRRWWGCYGSLFSSEPVIHVNTEATTLTTKGLYQVQWGDDDEGVIRGEQGGGGGGSVWQKNILMGKKCQLPDYSGVIVYDSAGQVITPAGISSVSLSLQ